MIDHKPYYQVKLILLKYKMSFLHDPRKIEDEKYAYTVIQKAYEINEKNIEMLDFEKSKHIFKTYFSFLDSKKSVIC